MAVVQCDQGHFYDNVKYSTCPHCENPLPKQPGHLRDSVTAYRPADSDVPRQALAQKKLVEFAAAKSGRDEKTVGVFRVSQGCDPVVGWLVCVEGKEKGRDYRLHAGRNFVGRALKMDIALPDDAQITAEDHCSVIYEPRKAVFLLVRGKGDGIAINGERVHDKRELQADDTVEIGASRFVFVPYCREGRAW